MQYNGWLAMNLNLFELQYFDQNVKVFRIGWATLFGKLKNWSVIFWLVKLASYFMHIKFEVSDLEF